MSKQHSTLSKGRNFTIESFDIVAGVDGALEAVQQHVGCAYVRTIVVKTLILELKT